MEQQGKDQPTNSSTQDKIPHGNERPDFELGPLNTGDVPRLVKELDARETVPGALVDKTAIEDAANRLASQTSNPDTVTSTYDSAVEAVPKKKLSLGARVGAGIAIGLVTVSAGLGITKLTSGSDNESNTPPDSEPVATAPANPTGEASPNPVETDVAVENEYSIPAGLDAESYSKKYVDIINAWSIAGSENIESLSNEMLDSSGPQEVFWQNVAQKNASAFAKGLFGDSWENNPSVSSFVDQMIKVNANDLQLLFMTNGSDKSVDKEPYTRWTELQSVTEEKVDDVTRKLTVTYSNHDNADKNSVDDNQSPPEGKITLTTKVSGADEVITSAE